MSTSEKMLMIRNFGSLDRNELFYFGASSKRNHAMSDRLIGRRGTGLKLAIVGALKLGLEMIVTSVDKNGPYTMTPSTRPVNIANQQFHEIVYNYRKFGVSRQRETQFFVEAMEQLICPIGRDDKIGFRILRELITNAHDGGRQNFADKSVSKKGSSFQISLVDKKDCREARRGEVIIYIKNHPDFEKILTPVEWPKYFKFSHSRLSPLFVLPGVGAIYPKADPNTTRYFVRDMLVGVEEQDMFHSSSFDYSVDDQSVLDDEALLKNKQLFKYYVARMLAMLTDRSMIATILKNVSTLDGHLENTAWTVTDFPLAPTIETMVAYREAWHQADFGEKPILASNSEDYNHRAQESGHTVCRHNFTTAFRDFLKVCGIKESADVVPIQGELKYKFVETESLSPKEKHDFLLARELFYKYVPQAKKFPLQLIKTEANTNADNICGLAGELETQYKVIYLNVKYFKKDEVKKYSSRSTVEFILITMLHEYVHCETQATDYTNKFVQGTVELAAQFILNQEKIILKT